MMHLLRNTRAWLCTWAFIGLATPLAAADARVAHFSSGKVGTAGYEKISFWKQEDGSKRFVLVQGKTLKETELAFVGIAAKGPDTWFTLKAPNGTLFEVIPGAENLAVFEGPKRTQKEFRWAYEGPVNGVGTFCAPCVDEADAIMFVQYLVGLAPGKEKEPVHTLKKGDPDRQAVLDALRIPVEKELKQPVMFVVEKKGWAYAINAMGPWAYVHGQPVQKNGKPIDYSRTPYQKDIDDGAFDDGIVALLKKENEAWTVAAYRIGGTDSPIDQWITDHGAPPELFKEP